MIKYTIILFVCGMICCKPGKKDIVTQKTILGMVFNNCTDSGMAGVKVYLQTFKNQQRISEREIVNGHGGAFTFNNIEIHSSDEYSYAVYIPSKSGDGATTVDQCRLDGTTMYFTKDESSLFLKPRITPGFLVLNLEINKTNSSNNSDSIRAIFRQKIFARNVPDLPYSFGGSSTGTIISQKGNIAGYPMGLYSITIDKWIGGQHMVGSDSAYLNWGASKKYVLTW